MVDTIATHRIAIEIAILAFQSDLLTHRSMALIVSFYPQPAAAANSSPCTVSIDGVHIPAAVPAGHGLGGEPR